jgi:tetratricopeptide (TPR) repeat protein
MQKYQDAIADYSQAILLNPFNIDFYQNRAFAYTKNNQFNHAIKDYTSLIKMVLYFN